MRLVAVLFTIITSLALYASPYVGDKACQNCHAREHKSWSNSHHALAMQVATDKTVLGDFNNAAFKANGFTTTFFKKNSNFFVRTDGADGKLHDFKIKHVFGLYPLQQYLIPFPDGRVQVLDIAWDARSKKEGGQRWFHLHPDEKIVAKDTLHWSGVNLNWNFMCADCHSTNLKKNYNNKTDTYSTKYDSINVSCEACHGPGEEHLKWAKNPKAYSGTLREGLSIDLNGFTKERWSIDAKTLKPKLLGKINHDETQMCAKCHARRSQLDDDFKAGDDFDDHYVLANLTQPLYFSDGKMKDEVYVYGSFLQSKMYEAGVTCSDCHDVHSLSRETLGDNVCSKCHLPSLYAKPEHTHHKSASKGASCITCHMPSRFYMGVDERNDHGFRVPRPDLSVDSDIPNACNNCHTDKDALWSTQAMEFWYGSVPVGHQNFSHQLKSLRNNEPQARKYLYELLMSEAPSIAKATATGYLGNYPSRQTYITTLQMLQDDDALVRLSALHALDTFDDRFKKEPLSRMIDDSVKMVRIDAARQLAALPKEGLKTQTQKSLERVLPEYIQSLLFNGDRAESQTALGTLYASLGQDKKAVSAFSKAIKLQPRYTAAYINFAHYYQSKKQEQKLYEILESGYREMPKNVDIQHALGLHYIRVKESQKALKFLEYAALHSANSQYSYVYAVATAQTDIKKAVTILKKSLQNNKGDLQTLNALVYYTKELGMSQESAYYQKQMDLIRK